MLLVSKPLLFSEGLLLCKLTYVKGDKPTLSMFHKYSLCISTVHLETSTAPPRFHFHGAKSIFHIPSIPDLDNKWLHPSWHDFIQPAVEVPGLFTGIFHRQGPKTEQKEAVEALRLKEWAVSSHKTTFTPRAYNQTHIVLASTGCKMLNLNNKFTS